MAQEVEFATKPQLARKMIERTLEAGVPCGWIAGDEVYGGNQRLRECARIAQAAVASAAAHQPGC